MEIRAACGGYAILCLATKRAYVGASRNLIERKVIHESQLRGGKHYCEQMQADWAEFGEACFRFQILSILDDPVEAEQAARRGLPAGFELYAQSAGFNGLHVQRPAPPALQGMAHRNGTPNKMIWLRRPDGVDVIFPSHYMAAKVVGCDKKVIPAMVRGRRISANGWTLSPP